MMSPKLSGQTSDGKIQPSGPRQKVCVEHVVCFFLSILYFHFSLQPSQTYLALVHVFPFPDVRRVKISEGME